MTEKRSEYIKEKRKKALFGLFKKKGSHAADISDLKDNISNEEVIDRPKLTKEEKSKRLKRFLNRAIIIELILLALVLLYLFKF